MEGKIAVILGAGTGVGRAAAVMLSQAGAVVVLVGRTLATLQETSSLCGKNSVIVADVASADAMLQLAKQVQEAHQRVDAIIFCAGINVPNRSLAEISTSDFSNVMNVNLFGAFNTTKAFLPLLRRSGGGTVVLVNSISGLQAYKVAGAAYASSKFALRGLAQSINAEEQVHNIRACSIFPGEIDTPLIDKRAHPPPKEAREKMLQARDIAECILLVCRLPPRAVVEEMTVRPICAAV